MSEAPLLQIRHLSGLFARPLDLTLHAGECISISGPSGCGKTRLLRAIADLEPVQADIRLRGIERMAMPAHRWRRQVMIIPAETAWWAERVGQHFSADCPPEWLHRLGLETAVMNWEVARLSSGERQRLGVLRALVLRPEVLLLDEPTANLDPDNTRQVESLLLEYLYGHPAGALWVSHDAAQRQRVANRHLDLVDLSITP